MGTRSNIAVQLDDGTVWQAYCHYDGYVAHNGRLLLDHYNSYELAVKLVEGGAMSSLGEKSEPDPAAPHSYDNRQENVTVYYHRDRGEELEVEAFANIEEFLEQEAGDREYTYLFVSGKWIVYLGGCPTKARQLSVTTALKKERI